MCEWFQFAKTCTQQGGRLDDKVCCQQPKCSPKTGSFEKKVEYLLLGGTAIGNSYSVLRSAAPARNGVSLAYAGATSLSGRAQHERALIR